MTLHHERMAGDLNDIYEGVNGMIRDGGRDGTSYVIGRGDIDGSPDGFDFGIRKVASAVNNLAVDFNSMAINADAEAYMTRNELDALRDRIERLEDDMQTLKTVFDWIFAAKSDDGAK